MQVRPVKRFLKKFKVPSKIVFVAKMSISVRALPDPGLVNVPLTLNFYHFLPGVQMNINGPDANK